MDFASMMAAQIAKTQGKTGTDKPGLKSKRDEEVVREKAYLAEQARLQAEREAKAEKKRKADDEERDKEAERQAKRQRMAEKIKKAKEEEAEEEEKKRRKRLGLPPLKKKEEEEQEPLDDDAEEAEEVTQEQIEEWLEKAGETPRLEGESDARRQIRYRRLKQIASRAMAMEQSRENFDPIPTYLEPVAEVECKVDEKLPTVEEKERRRFLARQIATWFNIVLKEWRIALARRDEATKKTMTGIQAAQSRDIAINDLKPLFRKLEKLTTEPQKLPDDLLKPIARIVCAAQERRYVHANDEYLQVSIGKAAWPIGVTMVGIHERSAREKLHESDNDKAHIMADESTRKFLQSIKRCLSFAQTRWPPEDIAQLMG